MDNNTLGIIVPVYNAEGYLDDCIGSILAQSWKEWRLILVDDGSTDESANICDRYAAQDHRIKVMHQSNMGLVNARHTGVKNINTKYVTFIDADDWIESSAYKYMMEIVNKYHPEIITAGIKRYYTSEDIHVEDNNIEEGFYDNDMLETKVRPNMLWRKDKNYFFLDPSLCTKIFLRDKLLNKFEDFQDRKIYYAEDSCIFFPYMMSATSMYCTHYAYYYHRQKTGRGNYTPVYIRDSSFFDKLYVAYNYLHMAFMQSNRLYINELLKQLDMFFIASVRYKEKCYKEFYIGKENDYLFPFKRVPVNSNIVLYGAGNVGKEYYRQIVRSKFCDIVAWIDKYNNLEAESLSAIKKYSYDYLVIAIDNERICHEVADELHNDYGISMSKILW